VDCIVFFKIIFFNFNFYILHQHQIYQNNNNNKIISLTFPSSLTRFIVGGVIYSIIQELPLGHRDPLNDLTCRKIGTQRSLIHAESSFCNESRRVFKREFSIVSFERSASLRAIRAIFAFFSFFFLVHTFTFFGGEKGLVERLQIFHAK